MILPRWVKFDANGVATEEAPASPRFRREWYPEHGYFEVPPELAHLPLSRLGIDGTAVIELPEPEATTEIVSKKRVIAVFKAMIDAGELTSPEMLKNILGGIADLTTDLAPGDDFDLLKPRVSEWLAPLGMTVDNLRAALAALDAEV